MRGDKYIPGALVTAYSIRRVEGRRRRADLVCMVTSDVSTEAVEDLELVYDHVVVVDELKYRSLFRPDGKSETLKNYTTWIDASYTKWQCLRLVQYKKVLFLDVDLVVVHSLMDLFELPTPAACFSSPFLRPYNIKGIRNVYAHRDPKTGKVITKQHGQEVAPAEIREALHGGTSVLIASTTLLEPSLEQFGNLIDMLESSASQAEGYGFPGSMTGSDEQALGDLYSRQNISFTHISQSYNYITWYPQWLKTERFPPRIFHFFGSTKPWDMKRDEWPDLEIWWQSAEGLVKRYPSLRTRGYFSEENLERGKHQALFCFLCYQMKQNDFIVKSHNLIKDGKPNCPILSLDPQRWRRLYRTAFPQYS